jgi:hypothetical protein
MTASAIEPWTVAACAHLYRRDLPDVDFDLIGAGNFALEEKPDVVASLISDLLGQRLAPQ